MSRYIDADTLEEKVKQYSLGYYEADEWAVPLCEISETPSIDIVRCKECKHRGFYLEDADMYICNACDQLAFGPMHFCSYGEREGE